MNTAMPAQMLGLFLLLCTPGLLIAQADRIEIAVEIPTKDGFIDATKETIDSQRDLIAKLRNGPDFMVLSNAEDPTIVVTVMGRGKGSQAYGQIVSTLSDGTILAGPIVVNNYWILAVLRVGSYERAFQCNVSDTWRTSPWRDCAGKLAEDIRAWARLNTEQLRSR